MTLTVVPRYVLAKELTAEEEAADAKVLSFRLCPGCAAWRC